MSFGAYWFPGFRLQSVLRLQPDDKWQGKPVVLVVESGKQSVVAEANEPAAECGIVPGLTTAQAYARSSGLIVRPCSEEVFDASRNSILSRLSDLGPDFSCPETGLYTVAMAGHGSRQEQVVEKLWRQFQQVGWQVQAGLGDTPFLAQLAAKTAPIDKLPSFHALGPELLAIPLGELCLSHKFASTMADWGIRTVGDFLALPENSVSERLDEEGRRWRENLLGTRIEPLPRYQIQPRFEQKIELEFRVENLEALLFMLRRIAVDLHNQLERAFKVVRVIDLKLLLEEDNAWSGRWELPEPTGRIETIYRTLENGLAGITTKTAVVGFRLEFEAVEPPHQQRSLYCTAIQNPWQLADTLDQLTGLLGHDHVGRPELGDSYASGRYRLVTLGDEIPELVEEEGPPRYGPQLRSFRDPVAADITLREGKPASIRSRIVSGSISAVDGPWRLSVEWWENNPVSQEEWDIEVEDSGIFRLIRQRSDWMLSGSYD